MDLCLCNMEEFINMRKDNLSIDEIREILNQLNNNFKIMNNKNIIHRDLKPENILISINKINECVIKLSDYGTSILNDNNNTMTISGTPLTIAPEVLKSNKISF